MTEPNTTSNEAVEEIKEQDQTDVIQETTDVIQDQTDVIEETTDVTQETTDEIETVNPNDWILKTYEKYMLLKIFVDEPKDAKLKQKYMDYALEHNESLKTNTSHINAGFDIFTPSPQDEDDTQVFGPNIVRCFGTGWEDTSPVNKFDFKIRCSAAIVTDTGKMYNTGYYMYPRSSLSKTNLRLANAVGIIDAGYRGHLIGMFDVVNINENELSDDRDYDCIVKKYDRLVQICAPSLIPIIVEIVDSVDELGEKTLRGDSGFGSTGK